ncbi:MAG TPA: hypothetical protein VMU22_11485 [Rhizomicrobium sp.]|nr:hypothetical protein [Rhizomicrobium sp.]
MTRLLIASLLLSTAAIAAPLPGSANDPHKPSASETHLFLSAICRNGIPTRHAFNCTALIDYPSDGAAFDIKKRNASGELSLDAVAYGHFTVPNAQEAYVTYLGLEPHADGFGGGILLRGADKGWKVVRWFPGGQMDRCVALPNPGPQRMLCLSGYTGMGETDSSVWLVDFSGPGGALKRVNLLKAQDGREGSNDDYYCKPAVSSHRPMLLSIDDLKRGHEDGVLAVSNISYAAAADVGRACAQHRFANMDEQSGTVRYRYVQGSIKLDPPPKFASVDY